MINRARFWFAVCAGKIGSPVMRFIINRVPRTGGTAAPLVPIYASAAYGSAPLVPIYASAAYGCALAHSPQTTREVRATFYSRLSQYGPHAAPGTFGREGPCPHGPGGGPPALNARFHRFLLVQGSFCASTRAGTAHAHLLSTWFNANGKRGSAHRLSPVLLSPPEAPQKKKPQTVVF
jgi:hypothetical protein